MIAPRNRLLAWVAVLIPFAGVGALVPSSAGIAWFLFGALFLVAGIDAVRARSVTRSIRVTLPKTVRLTRNRDGRIPIQIHNGRSRRRVLQIGLPLPAHVRSETDEVDVVLPEGSATSGVSWSCTPTARGRFALPRCYFRISSPWGFWSCRDATECDSELRVYPNLLPERKRLAALFLHRSSFGMHRHRMMGQGHEFEKLREYMPGDNYDDIYWKATAKRGRPITKLYQIERTQEVYVALDTSRLSARGAGNEPQLERFISAALMLGLAARLQGDLFGLIVFNDKVRRFIRAASGVSHFSVCRDALYMLNSRLVTPDFGELFSGVRLRLRRRALLMVLTDLGDPMLSESFARNVELVCRHHLVLVPMVAPQGAEPLFSRPDAASTDALYGKLAGHLTWRNLRELGRTLRHRGVELSLVEDDRLSTQIVTQYMNVKARQRL